MVGRRSFIGMVAMACSVAGVAFGAPPPAQPPGTREAAARIDRPTLEAPIRVLADDLLEGRAPTHRGDELAEVYLASMLEFLGLRPGAFGGAWQQRFAIVGVESHVPETWTFEAGAKRLALQHSDEFIAVSGWQRPEAAIHAAELVFVGYGIQAPEYGWDDYKGADLKGKVLVMMNNDPDWDASLFEGARRTYYGRWTYKYESAARQGAVAAIIIHTTPSAAYPWAVVQNSWGGEQFDLPHENDGSLAVRAWTTEDASRRLVALGGFDLDALVKQARSKTFTPVPLGVRTSLTITNSISRGQTGNVLGILPGSDPALRDQVVVFSAHHDHLGIGKPDARGDTIYNGAVDNASGVAQVLAIARAFAALPQPPRRSIMFAFTTGEESNLLGSYYLATHPPMPIERMVADVNFDAGNIFGRTRDVAIIGKGKSTLDEALVAAAALQGRVATDEPFPEHGSYYRADQFSFARAGVPGLYFRSGVDYIGRPPGWGREAQNAWLRAHYHQPSDELTPDWNFDGLIEDAQLGFYVGLAVASADQPPAWVPGSEFAHLRASKGTK
ncbi:MAG: M28 family peptidase [Thermoanaerobaculales bacterium]